MRKPSLALGLCLSAMLLAGACKQTGPSQAQAVAAPKGSAVPSVSATTVSAAPLVGVQPQQSAVQLDNSLAAPRISTTQQSQNTSSPLLEDVERHDGPFQVGTQSFTVWTHSMRIKGKTKGETEAITSIEIRDASGAVAHHEAFSYTFEKGEFTESCSASAEVLSGSMGNWLAISSECLPDAPMSGGPWQVFGVFNGKLVPWGRPLYTQGEWLRFVPGKITKVGTATSFGFDMIEFKVWAGSFYVTLPVRIDFSEPKLEPGIRCLVGTGRGLADTGCEVSVEAKRYPSDEDETFVRLFSEPTENTGIPAHVVIRKDSKVEFLAASARIVFDDSGGSIGLGVADDIWLKVRIDGKIGWIHTQEDFNAIGLLQSG